MGETRWGFPTEDNTPILGALEALDNMLEHDIAHVPCVGGA